MNDDRSNKAALPITDGPVPVFDCHVLLSQTESGVTARAANLDGVRASGATERDALMAIVKVFKKAVEQYAQNNEPIPFLPRPHKPDANEVERWVPVHL